MAKRDDVFPSKYLKSADLNGDPLAVTIVSAPLETLKNPEGKEQTKTVLYFRGTKKLLPFNLTNWDAVADVTGESDSDGLGRLHNIELYPAKTRWGARPSTASAFGRPGAEAPRSNAGSRDEAPDKKAR